MNTLLSRTASMLAAAAALSLIATPALARDRYRHHDRGGIDGGDVLAGLLIVGGIAAIATAASNKSKKDRQAREDARTRDDYRADGYRADDYRNDYRAGDTAQGGAPSAGYGYGDQRDDTDRYAPTATPRADYGRSGYGVDGAVDACVGEVERGSGNAAGRSVETVDGVNREGEGWRVAGRVQGGYGFSCLVDRDGRVKNVAGL